jgi:hypothetical protein
MTTIAYQGLGPAAALTDHAPRATRPGLLQSLGQAWCGWSRTGHEMLLKTEGTRLYLQCRNCFHETPGWSVGEDALGRRIPAPRPR